MIKKFADDTKIGCVVDNEEESHGLQEDYQDGQLLLQKKIRFQKRQLPESGPAKGYQKKVECEHAEENEQKKPDVAGKKGFQKMKTEEWRQIKMLHENTDGERHKAHAGATEPLISQNLYFPFTTSPAHATPVAAMEQHGPVRGKVTTPRESGSLQITVTQDCGAYLHQQHAGGHHSYLCNGHSRKVTTVDHQIRHHLYGYEDLVSCLLNYHRLACPSDLGLANIRGGPSDLEDSSKWRRVVSDSGQSFRVDLKNKSSHLCTELSITQRNRWQDYEHERDYRWTITVSGSGAKRKASSRCANRQLKEYGRVFQGQWKDSGGPVDFREDFASGYRLHFNDTVGCGVSVCGLKNQEGRLISDSENLYSSTEVKDLWITSSIGSNEPWKNLASNWKVSIQNTQNDLVRPRMEDRSQSRDPSKKCSSQPKSQCKVTKTEPDCFNEASMNELKQSNQKVKRIHEDNLREFSAENSCSNCKSGFHQGASNHKSSKKSRTCSDDIKPAPGRSRCELKYPWKENESKFKEELTNSSKPCSGHQRKDSWNGEGSGTSLSTELDLDNQLCDRSEVFSDEAKHKKKGSNTKIKVHPKVKNSTCKHQLMDSNRDFKSHWKGFSTSPQHMQNECMDNHWSYERGFGIHHDFYGDDSWSHEIDFGHDYYYHSQIGANGNQTYFHKYFAGDGGLQDGNRCEQKVKRRETEPDKVHRRK
uniref:uncharacterized protein n=1 Tax=Pristiophorus japonicus TaxID=55135 RepID=UPI00398EA5FF